MLVLPIVNRGRIMNVRVSLKDAKKIHNSVFKTLFSVNMFVLINKKGARYFYLCSFLVNNCENNRQNWDFESGFKIMRLFFTFNDNCKIILFLFI